jgi:hypothetical protein
LTLYRTLLLCSTIAIAFPAASDTRDALAQMWHDLAMAEYAEARGPAFAEALADCVSAVFASLDPADRDLLAETAMNPPEAEIARITALVPDHAEQMQDCAESIRPEDFAN